MDIEDLMMIIEVPMMDIEDLMMIIEGPMMDIEDLMMIIEGPTMDIEDLMMIIEGSMMDIKGLNPAVLSASIWNHLLPAILRMQCRYLSSNWLKYGQSAR